MSIWDEIRSRTLEGRLRKLQPWSPTGGSRRDFLATPDVMAVVDGPWIDATLARRCGQARAILEGFVNGDQIVARMPPSRNVNTVLALLEPPTDDVWEFRIGAPQPGLRIFGRFAQLNVFVATNWGKREDFLDAETRKDDSRKWRDEIVRCKTYWTRLFPTHDSIHGNTLHDYLSNARLPV